MNGKALCLLTKTDLGERCPGAGDVLHNVLQMLIRDAGLIGRCLPSSPVTPTSRLVYPPSPHSHPATPTWGAPPETFPANHLAHFVGQSNSVTLSPAPSVDSQAGSPQHADAAAASYAQAVYGNTNSNTGSSGSNQSDSDEDSYADSAVGQTGASGSPPVTPSYAITGPTPRSPKEPIQTNTAPAPTNYRNVAREFFPSDMPEPNTNGRLLWDFLQQLLNDPTQRYTNYIAWKNHETGVFKIVDPAGLAKLWGIQKNHLSMNYDKMSRALRYYYRVNILRKVQGERHCYQFLRNPTELKNIKNISLLRQQMSPNRLNNSNTNAQPTSSMAMGIKAEPEIEEDNSRLMAGPTSHDEDMPTDLSMPSSEHTSRKRPHYEVPKHLTLSDKHRISIIVGENLQKLSREREHHYSALNLKSENCEQ